MLATINLFSSLIDNITSKIVPLEKGVVIYGANALSLLPVVLFVPINVHV